MMDMPRSVPSGCTKHDVVLIDDDDDLHIVTTKSVRCGEVKRDASIPNAKAPKTTPNSGRVSIGVKQLHPTPTIDLTLGTPVSPSDRMRPGVGISAANTRSNATPHKQEDEARGESSKGPAHGNGIGDALAGPTVPSTNPTDDFIPKAGRCAVANLSAFQEEAFTDVVDAPAHLYDTEREKASHDKTTTSVGAQGRSRSVQAIVQRSTDFSKATSENVCGSRTTEADELFDTAIADRLANGIRKPQEKSQTSNSEANRRYEEKQKANGANSREFMKIRRNLQAQKAQRDIAMQKIMSNGVQGHTDAFGSVPNLLDGDDRPKEKSKREMEVVTRATAEKAINQVTGWTERAVAEVSTSIGSQGHTCDTHAAQKGSLCGLPALVANGKRPAKASRETSFTEAGPSGQKPLPASGIDIVTDSVYKKRTNQVDVPVEDLTVLKPSKKRTLGTMSLDTMFAPGQVASHKEYERYVDVKRKKRREQAIQIEQTMLKGTDEGIQKLDHESEDGHVSVDDASEADNPTEIPRMSEESRSQTLVPQSTAPLVQARAVNVERGKAEPKMQQRRERTVVERLTPEVARISRPTTGRKTVSRAAQAYSATRVAEGTMPADPSERYEAVDTIHHYYVRLSNSPDTAADGVAAEKMLGPYHMLDEANAVAAKEVKVLIADANGESVFEVQELGTGWSYQHAVDGLGMVTETLSFGGGFVAQATVSRDIAPPDQRYSLPSRAFTVPAKVYVVMEASRLYVDRNSEGGTDTVFDTASSTPPSTLSCFTDFIAANKKAGDRWLAAEIAQMKARGKGFVDIAEVRTLHRTDLRRMEDGGECFRAEVVERHDGGDVKREIWVQEVEVEGPRN